MSSTSEESKPEGKGRAPGRNAWRGASLALAAGALALYALQAWWVIELSGFDRAAIAVMVVVLAAFVAAGPLLSFGCWCYGRLVRGAGVPPHFRWTVVSAFLTVGLAFAFGTGKRNSVVLVGLFVVSLSLVGAGLGTILGAGGPKRGQKIAAALGLFVGLALVAWQIAWLVDEGSAEAERVGPASAPRPAASAVALDDPSRPGPYAVRTLTYGSGEDPRRPEFGSQVELVTESVDASMLVDGWRAGNAGVRDFAAGARTRFFGCDPTALPLQGRVWLPERDEPSPLVIMVHGRHVMWEPSDTGFDYLGELLASRGFVFVAIDQNFLNTNPLAYFSQLLSPFGFKSGLFGDLDVRAWLVLEHLRQWHAWNESNGPFGGRVDTRRIALLGHSFGGEAVAVAACFNRLSAHPDNALLRFDYGYDITAVGALAPVDGRYRPAGVATPIEGVDYFVVHGSHDGDVQSFEGSRTYRRVDLGSDPSRFKAYLYVRRANHGLFNRAWGRRDAGLVHGRALNVHPLLEAGEQERIAQVFVGAFLEASLRGDERYRELLRDERAGAAWLPDTEYIQHYREAGDVLLCSFEEDLDVATSTAPGGRISAEGLSSWSEQHVRLNRGGLETKAVLLGWSGVASYRVELPPEGIAADADARLLLSLADARGAGAGGRPPIDLTLRLTDSEGTSADVPLSAFGVLEPPFEATLKKWRRLPTLGRSELVFAGFELPLAFFVEQQPQLDLGRLSSLQLVFDRTPQGRIAVDDLGLRKSPAPSASD